MKSRKTQRLEHAGPAREITLQTTPRYSGRLFSTESLTVRLHDQTLANREIVRHPGGAAVLALTDDDCVLLVSQYRVAVDEMLTEIPAGKLETGEDPFVCAQRELSEETGCTADAWTPLGVFYPSPGYLDEKLHLYLARGLHEGEPHPDQGEYLTVSRRPFDELLAAIERNELRDAKTMLAVLLADRFRKSGQLN